MVESKPLISPIEFRLRSAFGCASADIDPAAAELATSNELVAVERRSRSGQIGPGRDESPDGPSIAVYYRNEEELSEGFLIALRAMGVAVVGTRANPQRGKGVKTRVFPFLPLCAFLL